jgi:hypothetical protein
MTFFQENTPLTTGSYISNAMHCQRKTSMISTSNATFDINKKHNEIKEIHLFTLHHFIDHDFKSVTGGYQNVNSYLEKRFYKYEVGKFF